MNPDVQKKVRNTVLAVVLVSLVGVVGWLTFGPNDKTAVIGPVGDPAMTLEPDPPASHTPTPSPTPSATQECDDGKRMINASGQDRDSLPADCGSKPVTVAQEKASGLSIACGGRYPIILYKTYTKKAQVSICGVDSSGEKFRVVVKPATGPTIDMPGHYNAQVDAFIGNRGDTEYGVLAYDGTLVITDDDGDMKKYTSTDWMSLDNESDVETN